MVIDGDGHCNEPRDLFDRYLEKEFRERGPKVVDASGTRWMIEGKFLPRPVGTWGHGSSSGYLNHAPGVRPAFTTLPRPCLALSQARSLGPANDRAAAGLQRPGLGMTRCVSASFSTAF